MPSSGAGHGPSLLPTEPLQGMACLCACIILEPGQCALSQTVRPWGHEWGLGSSGWTQPGVGVPPSHGRPGPPAFGYSSWPGRWLEGQGAGCRGALCPSLPVHPPEPRSRERSQASPPFLTHHSQAQQLATACSSRNRVSGAMREQGASGTSWAFPAPGVVPTLSAPLGRG